MDLLTLRYILIVVLCLKLFYYPSFTMKMETFGHRYLFILNVDDGRDIRMCVYCVSMEWIVAEVSFRNTDVFTAF